MPLVPILDVAGPGVLVGMLVLTLGALVVLFFLIVLIESIAMQLMDWDNFRGALRGALLANLASTLIGFLMLGLVPKLGLLGLLIAWLLSVVIEGLVLMRLKRDAKGKNWRVAVIANLASYVLLLLPAFLMSE